MASLAVLGMLLAGSAQAQDLAVPGAHRHDGLFLRMDLGFGLFGATVSDQDAGMHGPLLEGGIAVGGSLSDNFSLAGHLWGISSPSPTFTQGNVSVTPDDTSVGQGALGLEADYYLMPYNVYLSATIGVSTLGLKVGGVSGNTQVGGAGQLAIGKEWWVSDEWGIGLAGQFSFSFNKDNETSSSPTWSVLSGALVFSATYN